MSGAEEMGRAAWAERSAAWAASAAPGKAQDDTLSQMLIAAAAIRPGEFILDTASGTGNPAISMALAMDGRGGIVCGDFTLKMIEAARGRAETLLLATMRFACCDMVALPFRADTFDGITCRFGLMSVKDKVAAAREALRVLKPGGRAAYMVWGLYEENPPFHVPRRAVARFFGESEGPPPGRHVMGAPGAVKDVLDRAGFVRAEEREARCKNTVADPLAYVSRGLKRSFGPKVEGLSESRFAALVRSVLDAWAPYMEGGVLQVPNHARIGLGWKAP